MLDLALLAGGLATRLHPLTETIPKSLVPVAGEPFVAHQLRLLASCGVRRIVFCLGHLGEMVRDFVGDGVSFGIEAVYVFDGPRLLGTGGALKRALPELGAEFFVLYGDSYLPCDYAAVAAAFRSSGKKGLMTVYANEGRWDSSNVEYANGHILAYNKKEKTSAMRHIDYGLGCLRSEVFDDVPEDRPFDLADVYGKLLRESELAAYEVWERFYEIGSPVGIDDLDSFLKGRRKE